MLYTKQMQRAGQRRHCILFGELKKHTKDCVQCSEVQCNTLLYLDYVFDLFYYKKKRRRLKYDEGESFRGICYAVLIYKVCLVS